MNKKGIEISNEELKRAQEYFDKFVMDCCHKLFQNDEIAKMIIDYQKNDPEKYKQFIDYTVNELGSLINKSIEGKL